MSDNKIIYATPGEVIFDFYTKLDQKKHAEAFACLTPDFQERIWGSDPAVFEKGYLYTIEISNIKYAPITENEDKAQYNVFYSDKINTLHHPLIDWLPKSTIGELPKAKEVIEQFNEMLITDLGTDQEEMKKIQLWHYFQENNVEDILILSKANYDRNDELFTQTVDTFQRYRRALCVNSEKGWHIDGLRYQ